VGNAGDNIITVSAFIACVQHLRQQLADTTRIFYLCAVAMGQPYVEQWRADLQVARYLNNTPVKIDNTLQTIDRVSSDLNCVRPSKCWSRQFALLQPDRIALSDQRYRTSDHGRVAHAPLPEYRTLPYLNYDCFSYYTSGRRLLNEVDIVAVARLAKGGFWCFSF